MARRKRAEVVVEDEVGVYHCIQRVVRRAFLCGVDPVTGNSFDHRREWIRDRLESLAGLFGVEIAAFAVMSNHVHVILRNRPDIVAVWSNDEVARRWLTLFPGRVGTRPEPTSTPIIVPVPSDQPAQAIPPGISATPTGGCPNDPLDLAVKALAADAAMMTTIRGRLSSLSWFMRCLAEPIARRANKEDHCSGHFWEGRFSSQRLLDEAALLACSVYVDLNPIRAGLADRPETSKLTSAHERIMALFNDIPSAPRAAVAQDSNPAASLPDSSATELPDREAIAAVDESPAMRTVAEGVKTPGKVTAESSLPRDGWLSPIELNERATPLLTALPQARAAGSQGTGSDRARRASDRGLLPMTLAKYLELIDWTGRQLRAGTKGVIPASLASILDRLQLSMENWLETVARFGHRFHHAVGLAEHLEAEAQRLGVARLHGLHWSQAAFATVPRR